MIGACAGEAQEVYENIQNTEDRLLNRLLRYLLPEVFHLPHPAAAIAKARPRTSSCWIGNTHTLLLRDSEKELSFTPLFDTKLLNAQIRFIGTDSGVYDLENTKDRYVTRNNIESISNLLVGIESPEKLKSLDKTTLYVDWSGDELEKRKLLSALSNSTWTWNELLLQRQNGLIDDSEVDWQTHFSPEKDLERRINKQFLRHFHLLTHQNAPPELEASVLDVLQDWLGQQKSAQNVAVQNINQWKAVKGNFTWVKIKLPYPILLKDVEKQLTISLNHFIVVNREKQEKDDNETYFSRSIGLEAIALTNENKRFHSLKGVYNQIKNEPLPYKPLTQLVKEKDQVGYSYRYGGVGRLDNYNAWQRLDYIYSVFRKEQRIQSIFNHLGDKMSLDEIHETIGSQIDRSKSTQADENITQESVYLFVNPGRNTSQIRVKIEYWTTDGEAANGLKPNASLIGNPPIAGLDQEHIQLVISPYGGKDRYSEMEKIQALQDKLNRRGRVITAQDVKCLCYQKMGKALKGIDLRSYFETNKNTKNGGIQRAMEVILKVDQSGDTNLQQLANEIELTLLDESIGTLPYKVTLQQIKVEP